MDEFPVVAIIGPRQVGKTTLAKEIGLHQSKEVVYLDMEKMSDRRKLDDPEIYFGAHRDKVVIIDEVQAKPEILTAMRPEVDEHRLNGRFLLTGSANPDLVKGVSETLAGRIVYLKLTPISLSEASSVGISWQQHWFRGGFPLALTAKNDKAFHRWMGSYIRSYIERDMQMMFGYSLSPSVLRNLLEMIAANSGTFMNVEMYARSLGLSGPTVKRYFDLLEGAFLIRRLPAWFSNINKRIIKSPKIYLRDTGMLHAFANVETPDDLPGNIVAGGSWESYVVEEIIRALPDRIRPFFYRTQHGAEVDLVLVKGNKPLAAIEIKYSAAPTLSSGFYQCKEDLGTQHHWVVYTGDDTYHNSHGVIFMSLMTLIDEKINIL